MTKRLQDVEIGDWFASPFQDLRFEVVAMDEAERTVEIQYYDGTVEELDFESWPQFEAEETAPPEDWAGAYDAEREDLEEDQLAPRLAPDAPYDDLQQLLN